MKKPKKPSLPKKPKEPSQTIPPSEERYTYALSTQETISLSTVFEYFRSLVDDFDPEQLQLYIDSVDDNGGWGSYNESVITYIDKIPERVNTKYDSELRDYNIKLSKYNDAVRDKAALLAQYEIDMAAYSVYLEGKEEERRKKQKETDIKYAKKLLAKYGVKM